MRKLSILAVCIGLSACGTAYISPSVREQTTSAGLKVRVLPMTAETVLAANRSAYAPQELPDAFFRSAGTGGASPLRFAQAPDPVFEDQEPRHAIVTRPPPQTPLLPYRIGVGDVLFLAVPSSGSTVEQLSGLLAAQSARQGYTVQDDGAIAIPNVGRVPVAGMTIDEAEATMFQRLVESGIEPAFSLEIAEFLSKSVTIGGAIATPGVLNIGLKPLRLGEALQLAGGVSAPDVDYVTVRVYRDGELYQIPVTELFSRQDYQNLRLADGDSIFLDTTFELEQAQSYFEQQITVSQFKQNARTQALQELQAAVSLRRGELDEQRGNFASRMQLDAVDRDYVYLTGEVAKQSRVPLPFNHDATLADVVYGQGGFPNREANPKQFYVLRGSDNPAEHFGLTAYQLDARMVANLLLAARFKMRPNDIVFIAEQPVTKWSRVVSQITPGLITTAASAAAN
ncbi:polysaccharide biosynthesis/export family protein [Antarcticimicrobium sediminis]|uniref:Sugar transporter n=1 Tax=Antarcticimicrobium sediminis TaxID=2546227 RepID=A0A4R5EVF5_9RHOB|nr:polysaccharide biosynthesis/export family protein [Antarcticimicrobium sediminis]TDE38861.1 sugar transporter [Antarcticimicrobium sediminis]